MRYLADCFKVRNVVSWISDALQVHRFCLIVNQMLEIIWLVPVDKLGGYP